MNDTLAGLPWSVVIPLLGVAAGYGASRYAQKRTEADVNSLREDHHSMIAESRKAGETTRDDLSAYRLYVAETFVRKTDLGAMEDRLGTRLDDLKSDFYGKVDEIKADFGKRSIEHAIKNAIAAALAPEQIAQIRGRRS